MNKLILFIFIIFASWNTVIAQKALEFASGDGNPTGIGPVVSTTIRFRHNTDNPTGNTFATYTPPLTVTATLSNDQYVYPISPLPGNPASMLGFTAGAGSVYYNPLSDGGGVNADFTASGASAGNGISVIDNFALRFSHYIAPLETAGVLTNARARVVDLTLAFNRPVNNPILHLSGLGGSAVIDFTAEFDLLSSNVPVTLSKSSGTANLIVETVSGTQRISNNSLVPSGANHQHGSILAAGNGITTIALRVYLRGGGDGTNSDWMVNNNTRESWSLSLSLLENCTKPPITGTPDSYTQTGVSSLVGFAGGWPGNVPNGFIAIESKDQGFVITRVSSSAAITAPVEGMLIYDIAANCVKLYSGTWNCLAKDCN